MFSKLNWIESISVLEDCYTVLLRFIRQLHGNVPAEAALGPFLKIYLYQGTTMLYYVRVIDAESHRPINKYKCPELGVIVDQEKSAAFTCLKELSMETRSCDLTEANVCFRLSSNIHTVSLCKVDHEHFFLEVV